MHRERGRRLGEEGTEDVERRDASPDHVGHPRPERQRAEGQCSTAQENEPNRTYADAGERPQGGADMIGPERERDVARAEYQKDPRRPLPERVLVQSAQQEPQAAVQADCHDPDEKRTDDPHLRDLAQRGDVDVGARGQPDAQDPAHDRLRSETGSLNAVASVTNTPPEISATRMARAGNSDVTIPLPTVSMTLPPWSRPPMIATTRRARWPGGS